MANELLLSDMQMRLQKVIDHCFSKRGKFAELSKLTDTSAAAWNQLYHGRSKPTGAHLEALCQMFPQYTLWLMTGQTNEAAGQTSPEIEQLRELEKKVAGK